MKESDESNYDLVDEFFNINLKIAKQIAHQQQAILNISVENVTSQIKMLSKSKDYKEIISEQKIIINETNSKIQDISKKTAKIMNQSKNDISIWIEKSIDEAAAAIIPFSKII
ncbi:MAG: hypothetical protein CMF45_09710 [Legionellales bacterium]|nr:hypothetical protein [Legionellales bacterium]